MSGRDLVIVYLVMGVVCSIFAIILLSSRVTALEQVIGVEETIREIQ